MTAILLETKRVAKPWGRRQLWPGFADPAPAEEPVGEIWFAAPDGADAPLLVKYLFTSERLSVQVHPDDAAARAAGYPRGKDEAWVVLAAEPDSTIALGTLRPLTQDELRAAALDGSIEQLLDWKPVKAGDVIYSPAGTVHAIGAGITLVEVQQNVDLTYRLYDYGRPRELHLEAAVAVADARLFEVPPVPGEIAPGRVLLAEGPKFVLERWSGGARELAITANTPAWLVPLASEGSFDGLAWRAGECVEVHGPGWVEASGDADLLVAYPGDRRV
ncbi:class I mannose-6-phosphate isomerase [Sphingomonas sp. GlSt437]|uniref:class I mannose-6-phosphate isomerase n=1 Tax=Sphingomonas sp. GlSt437 TaxID=3389970 RepID=UPI003A88EBBB